MFLQSSSSDEYDDVPPIIQNPERKRPQRIKRTRRQKNSNPEELKSQNKEENDKNITPPQTTHVSVSPPNKPDSEFSENSQDENVIIADEIQPINTNDQIENIQPNEVGSITDPKPSRSLPKNTEIDISIPNFY